MQVAQKNDPSRQREDTEQSARNETRACDFRSCIEAFAEENPKEAAGNRAEQDCESGLFERHTQEERYRTDCEADGNADGGLGAIDSQQKRNTYSRVIRKSKRQRQDSTVCGSFFAELPRRIVGHNKGN